MKILVCFLIICNLGFLNAQVAFEKYTISDVSDGIFRPEDVSSGDIDGDGLVDVITCSDNGEIYWCKNDGANNFEGPRLVNEFLGSLNNVFVVDIDGDGDQDIISDGFDDILLHENGNGLGGFAWERSIGLGSIQSIGDIDGDGDLDILSASFDDFNTVWYENTDGSGNFSSAQIVDNLAYLQDGDLVDIDNDGDLDIVGKPGFGNSNLSWYQNIDGNGNFSDPIVMLESPSAIGVDLVFIDIDNDGRKDLCQRDINSLSWRKKGINDNDYGPVLLIQNPVESIRRFFLVDADLDGDIDIYSLVADKVFLQKNTDGLGNFTSPILVSERKKSIGTFKFSDINGDGLSDLLYASADRNELGVERNLAGSDMLSTTVYPIPTYPANPIALHPVDMDGDGDLDFTCASWEDDKITWYENLDGLGSFSGERLINNCAEEPEFIITSDIDGDTDADVIVSYGNATGPAYIVWYKNVDGTGTLWTIDTAFTNTGQNFALEVADMDSDGDLDIIGMNTSLFNRFFWLENVDGLGNFGSPKSIIVDQDLVLAIKAADLDGDGDNDLIAGSQDIYYWVENLDGLGNFGPAQILSGGFRVDFLQTDDLDNDGDLDILVAGGEEQKLYWHENIGTGNFDFKQVIANSVKDINSIQTADVDGDGDQDIVTGASGTSTYRVIYIENLDGLGSFGEEQLVFQQILSFGAPFVVSGDFNGDNAPDIIAAEPERDRISWFENQGVLFNEIFGQVFLDTVGNDCDSLAMPLEGILVTTQNNTSVLSSDNGYFQFIGELGTYSTTLLAPDYFDSTPETHNSDFIDYGITDTINFCLTANQIANDLNIVVLPITETRPGFETTYKVLINNTGTTTLSGSAKFQFDENALSFSTTSDPNIMLSDGMLSYTFQDLASFGSHEIDLTFLVSPPPIVNIEDSLTLIATIDFSFGDVNEQDNEFVLIQEVIGSFDPNDITVLEGPEIFLEEAENYLHYIVRFQNTGTASAINVRIENLLDPNLDWQTFKLDAHSHPVVTRITDENLLVFSFDNINLPDSTANESDSHGYIAYKIKPVNTVTHGDRFSNSANIFFDFNEPILTNTVTTEIVLPVNITVDGQSDVQVYPIPVEDFLLIKSELELISLLVYDRFGQNVLTIIPTDKVDFSNLPAGVYFCKITNKNGHMFMRKIIKN